jgi:hypothetical protein
VRASVARARIGDPILHVAMRTDAAMCIHCDYDKTPCVCVPSTWPHEERASHSRTCRAEPHRPHAHASTRVCIGTSIPYTRADAHERSTYIYMCLIRACLCIQAGTHTRTRCRRAHRRRARSHAHAHGRDAATCTLTAYSSHKHPSIYRDRTRLSLHIDTNLHTHMARSTRARALARTGLRGHALVCTACPNRRCVQRR